MHVGGKRNSTHLVYVLCVLMHLAMSGTKNITSWVVEALLPLREPPLEENTVVILWRGTMFYSGSSACYPPVSLASLASFLVRKFLSTHWKPQHVQRPMNGPLPSAVGTVEELLTVPLKSALPSACPGAKCTFQLSNSKHTQPCINM